MAREYSQVNFRIPTRLKEKIEASAISNEQSITAELVSRLEQSFESPVHHETEMYLMKTIIKEQQQQINQLIQAINKVVKVD